MNWDFVKEKALQISLKSFEILCNKPKLITTMIAKIIPLDTSFSSDWLSYEIDRSQLSYLKLGSIVSIPIKNKEHIWAVFDITEDLEQAEDIRKVTSVLCSYPILSKYQLSLIINLSIRYMIPLHRTLNLFLPKYIFSRLEKTSFSDTYDLDEETNIKQPWEAMLYHISTYDQVFDILKDMMGKEKNMVIVVWDDLSIDSLINKLDTLKSEGIICRNSSTYAKKYKDFINILKHKKNIIVWTRSILRYNLARYDKVVYIEDSVLKNLFNYEDKYNNLDMLALMQKGWFDIDYLSVVPSIDLMMRVKKWEIKYKMIRNDE